MIRDEYIRLEPDSNRHFPSLSLKYLMECTDALNITLPSFRRRRRYDSFETQRRHRRVGYHPLGLRACIRTTKEVMYPRKHPAVLLPEPGSEPEEWFMDALTVTLPSPRELSHYWKFEASIDAIQLGTTCLD